MLKIEGPHRDALILSILKRLEEAKPHADAAGWERGWEAALERFRANPCEESLVPAFIRHDQPVRCEGEFYRPIDASEKPELAYVRALHEWIAEQFAECRWVLEFGCGTGLNLAALAKLMPGKDFHGFDLSEHAVKLVREAALAMDLSIGADRFDMLHPGARMPLEENTGVLTFGAMEQLGDFRPFLDYLLRQRPVRVVHIEPIPELLDADNLVDWLSLKFHEKRGYTTGLLPYLTAHPGVEVEHVERSNFGSLLLESYARIVWRPK